MQTRINIYQSESQIVRDAIDKVIVQVYRKKRDFGHKSFLLTGCSAGCGTTYTAINMAVALANAGWKTVLVDCDIRKGMEYKRLNQDVKTGLSDYLTGKVKETIYSTNNEKLDYVPCGNSGESPVRLLATREMELLDSELKENYDFVIYDFPSVNIVPDAGIMIPVVDDVILVVGMNETTKDQLAAAKAKVKETEGKYMGVIANKLELPEYRHYVKDYDYFKSDRLKETHDRRMKRLADSGTVTPDMRKEMSSAVEKIKNNRSADTESVSQESEARQIKDNQITSQESEARQNPDNQITSQESEAGQNLDNQSESQESEAGQNPDSQSVDKESTVNQNTNNRSRKRNRNRNRNRK